MEEAKAKGLANEKMMWDSIEDVEEMLCALRKEHPHKYWKFIRKTHGVLFKGHYTEDFARWDVGQISYTNRKGERKEGEYWSVEQVREAMKNFAIPNGINEWDMYVAANVLYSDLNRELDNDQILKATYLFFFKDEDWSSDGSGSKIWDYMACKMSKKD